MKPEDYLAKVEKTMDDLRKEWRPDAEKRAKLQVIMNEIAQKEHIHPDSNKLEREIKHVKEHYPDADERNIRTYVAAQMTNELVFELLEGSQKKDSAPQKKEA
jgi:FKBP-type peptidyl-prolyl cis-trans isomerase (trigger factor)